MRAEQLSDFRTIGRPQLHADGVWVAFEVTAMNLDDDRYERSIWLHDGSGARRFTSGRTDTLPRWSPSGDRLAFLRKGEEKTDRAQVAVMAADGGEAVTITDLPLGVSDLDWSPDGSRLAILGVDWTAEWSDLDDEERERRPRRLTAAVYRFDNRGWLHDRRKRVYLVDAGGGDPVGVGDRDGDELAPVWSPDGARLAYLAEPVSTTRMEPGWDVVEYEVATGTRTVRHARGGWSSLAYGPDGDLYAIGAEDPWAYPGIMSLWRLDEDGPRDLTGHLDRSVWSFLLPADMARPVWLADGDLLIGLEDSGRVGVIRVAPDGTVQPVVEGDRFVTGFGATADGSRIVFTATHPTSPGELYELRGEGETALTELNDAFAAEAGLVAPTHRRVETAEGVEVDVWTYVPEGSERLPVLLNIHGGPASQYGFSFFDEFQVYVAAGYAVVACNPRGSSGRGEGWLRAVTGDGWGTVDLHDVLTVLDAELEREPRLDPDRLGIMGGSYGGFLTAWVIAHDHRFSSAVVERALLGWESFSGTSDIGRDFSQRYLGAVPPADHARLRTASPLAVADQIRTPTLIVHSENDFRCPIEQAEQLFMTLLRNEVEVAFVRFPGEGHELSRSGSPRHRQERFDQVLDWHQRLL